MTATIIIAAAIAIGVMDYMLLMAMARDEREHPENWRDRDI